MNLLLFLVFLALALLGFLLFRYLRLVLGLKDSNYPIVQRAERKPKPKDTSELFLPGSRMEVIDLEKTLEDTPEVQKLDKKKPRTQRIPFSKRELKNAVLLEELLHPKFKSKKHGGDHGRGHQRGPHDDAPNKAGKDSSK